MSPRLKAFGLFTKKYQVDLAKLSATLANKTIQYGRRGIRLSGENVKASIKNRREAGRVVAALTKPKPVKIDRVVNARGNGIRFIRKGGKIIPIRAGGGYIGGKPIKIKK